MPPMRTGHTYGLLDDEVDREQVDRTFRGLARIRTGLCRSALVVALRRLNAARRSMRP